MNIKYNDSNILMINDIYLQFIKKINIWLSFPKEYKEKYYTLKIQAGTLIIKQIHNLIIIKEIYFLPEFREKGLLKRIIKYFEIDNIFRENKIKIQSILNKNLWSFLDKRAKWFKVKDEYSMILNSNRTYYNRTNVF
jgi:hypothetical protein